MSSSDTIWAQINQCKNEITKAENKIKELEQLLTNQNGAIQQYASQKVKYIDQLETQHTIFSRLSEHTDTCVLAKQYNEHMNDDMSSTRRNNIYGSVDDQPSHEKRARPNPK